MFKENFSSSCKPSFLGDLLDMIIGSERSESFELYLDEYGLDTTSIIRDMKMSSILKDTLEFSNSQELKIDLSESIKASNELIKSLSMLARHTGEYHRDQDYLRRLDGICRNIDEQAPIVLSGIESLKEYCIKNRNTGTKEKVELVKFQLKTINFLRASYNYGYLLNKPLYDLNLAGAY